MQGGNFLPERFSLADAPAVYVFGCANGVYPVHGDQSPGMNPLTGQFLGPNTAAAVGTLVPGTGNPAERPVRGGRGDRQDELHLPGARRRAAVRHGLRRDRHAASRTSAAASAPTSTGRVRATRRRSPPTPATSVTVRYSQLQTLGTRRVDDAGRAGRSRRIEYDAKLPTATAWNVGMQTMLPWSTSFDVAYTGRHNYNAQVGGQDFPININTIDLGTAFRPALQDPTLAPSAIAGASSLAAQNPNQVRGYRGFGNITYRQYDGWRTFHSMELAVNRRFINGVQFGFSDTIVISDVLGVDPRFDHGPDGQVVLRADQEQAQDLLGNQHTPRHNMRATFVWQLPQIPSTDNEALKVLRLIANDWQLSGIWTGTSGIVLYRDAAIPDGQRQCEPDRLPGLRAAHPHRRRSGRGLQQRSLPAVQHRRVPGTAGRERRPGVGERISLRLFPERARSVDRA